MREREDPTPEPEAGYPWFCATVGPDERWWFKSPGLVFFIKYIKGIIKMV